MPAYLQWFPGSIHSFAIIGQRITWTCIFLLVAFVIAGQLKKVLQPAMKLENWPGLLAGTLLISIPWSLFVWGPLNGETLAVALGFFLGPLLLVLIGLVVFKERMSLLQWLAAALTVIAVISSIWQTGGFSWIAITIAICFALYVVVRKYQPVPVLSAFFIENLVLLPAGVWACMEFDGVAHPFAYDIDLLMKFSGVAVLGTLGMSCWLSASRKLTLTLLGLMSYLEPFFIFLVAIIFLAEKPGQGESLTYVLIGLSVLLLVADGIRHLKRNPITASK